MRPRHRNPVLSALGWWSAGVLLVARWWAWTAYLLALVAASSRVVDGVHFPHDVLAGATLGVGTTVACALVLTSWTLPLAERIGRPSRSLPPERR